MSRRSRKPRPARARNDRGPAALRAPASTRSHAPVPRGWAALAGAGVFLTLFLVYFATVIPTMVDQDSGELVSSVHVLGIAHPTGYPLWVLLGRLFDIMPLGHTSAYRVALLSVLCAAAAGGIVTLLALRLTGSAAASVVGGLVFGLWFPTWSQAVRAEVYALTALLVALTLVALVRWDHSRTPGPALVLALACGFVSMHHRTAMLAVAPALIAAAVLTRPRRLRIYAAAVALFAAPFLFYIYLPIRAAALPPLNWTNPSTWSRFWEHMLATQYQHFAFSHSLAEMLEVGRTLLPDVLAASAPLSLLLALVGLPLIAWGWYLCVRRRPVVAWSLAAGCGALVVWVLQWGETSDLKVFLQPLGEVLGLCTAVGLADLGARLRSAPLRAGVIVLVGVVLAGGLLLANWRRSDLSNMWEHRDRWAAVLTQMAPNAVFVSDFDVPSFATLYLQNVENMRRDISLLRAVRLPDQWYVDLIRDPELRAAVRASWAATSPELDMHDRAALFAQDLATRLQGRRPVYALHAPFGVRAAEPPYFIGISEDLVEVGPRLPDAVRRDDGHRLVGRLPGGVEIASFAWDRPAAGTGQMVGFTVWWRLSGPAANLQFGVSLVPKGMKPERFERALLPKGRFVQGFPVAYGRPDAGPTAAGTVYEQRGSAIVPSNAPAGSYRTFIGIGPKYAGEYQGWIEVGQLEVRARPLPRNGP